MALREGIEKYYGGNEKPIEIAAAGYFYNLAEVNTIVKILDLLKSYMGLTINEDIIEEIHEKLEK